MILAVGIDRRVEKAAGYRPAPLYVCSQSCGADMEKTLRRCNVCGKEKPLSEFYKDKSRPLGHRYECKKCANARLKAYRAKRYAEDAGFRNKLVEKGRLWRASEKGKLTKYLYQAKSKYGVCEQDIRDLLDAQKGCCAICGVDFGTIKLRDIRRIVPYCIDHDHVTGQVRGLLCDRCNLAIGVYEMDIYEFKSRIDSYLLNSIL